MRTFTFTILLLTISFFALGQKPIIHVSSHHKSLTTTNKPYANFEICVEPPNSSPIISIKMNGSPLKGITPSSDSKVCNKYKFSLSFPKPATYLVEIEARIGNNKTTVARTIEYQNDLNLNSINSSTDYLLTIGITNYKYQPRLPNAEKDAEDIENILISKYQFSQQNTSLLLNENATKINILNGLKQLHEKAKNDKRNSNLMVYFSGHGYKLSNGEIFIAPYDAFPSNASQSISGREIEKLICDFSNFQNIYIVTDACQSGGLFSIYRKPPEGGDFTDYIDKRAMLKSRRAFSSVSASGFAIDGIYGKNSPFAKQFIDYLEDNTHKAFPAFALEAHVSFHVRIQANQLATQNSLQRCTPDIPQQEGEFIFRLKNKNSVPVMTPRKIRPSRSQVSIRFVDDNNSFKGVSNVQISSDNCTFNKNITSDKFGRCYLPNTFENCFITIRKAGYETKVIKINSQNTTQQEVTLKKTEYSILDNTVTSKKLKKNKDSRTLTKPKYSKSKTTKTYHFVQLGVFKTELSKKVLLDLQKYGPIYSVNVGKGRKKYIVGKYSNTSTAEKNTNKIKRSFSLYSDAFTVVINSNQLSKMRRISFNSVKYKIQLGTFSNLNAKSELKRKYGKLGLVEVEVKWKNGKKLHTIFLGTYNDKTRAERDLKYIKKDIPKAFIVPFDRQKQLN